jgi:hypothetical protein
LRTSHHYPLTNFITNVSPLPLPLLSPSLLSSSSLDCRRSPI